MQPYEAIVVADTETTGLGADAGVVEYAHAVCRLVEIDGNEQLEIISESSSLIDPKQPIPAGASAVHGITDDMVAGQPTLGHYLSHVFNDGPDNFMLVGHNFIRYDWKYLKEHFPRPPVLGCSLNAARKFLDLPNNKLETIYAQTGGPAEEAHRAAADVRMTVHIINHMLKSVSWAMLHEAMTARPPATMPFGKHKGKKVSDLPRHYIEWALENMTGLSDELRDAMLEVKKGW